MRLIRRKTLQLVQSLALLVALLISTACTPALPPPERPLTGDRTFSEAGEIPRQERWWLLFGDATLTRLIDQAHRDNLTLQIAWNRLDSTAAIMRKSRSGFFPTLDLQASATTSRTETAGTRVDTDQYGVGLAASYELDLWGRVRAEYNAADFSYRATAEDLRTAYQSMTAEVAATWYRLVEQYGQQEILRQQLDINSKTLELIDLQFRTGKVGIADILQQKQLIERNRGELAQVAANITVLANSLAVLLAREPGQLGPLEPGTFSSLPPLPATGLKAELLERRPDIRAAWLSVLATNQQTRAAMADRFPKLSLGVTAESTAAELGNLFDDWTARLFASLVGPLIDGGRRRAEVERTRALTEEALNLYSLKVLGAIAEVEEALTREQRQNEYLASLEKQLGLAEQATQLIRNRYTKGAEEYQRVLASILSQQTLQRSVLTARRELYEYRIALYRSLGGSWEITRPEDATSRDAGRVMVQKNRGSL